MAKTLAVGSRTLTWDEVGDPDGLVVFHIHGAGGSRLEMSRMADAAKEAGLCLVGVDRPGYGGTTDLPLQTPGDMAGDIAALADSLGLTTFYVSGLSAGGMFAQAVADRLRDRVTRVVAINPAPPIADPVIGAAAPADLAKRTKLAAKIPGILAFLLKRMGKDVDDRDKGIARMRKTSPADAQLFERDPEAFRLTAEAAKIGRAQGYASTARDFALCGKPWGFDPRTLTCELIVVGGEQDPLVAASRKLAEEVPGARFVSVPGGHLSVLDLACIPSIVSAMATGAVRA